MKLLLDTHALLWWLLGDRRLSLKARAAIAETGADVLASAVSAMEIGTKHRIGKLPEAERMIADLGARIARQGFAELPLSLAHARLAGSLVIPHKDPFDRMLIAQSLIEQVALVSNETLFDGFGVNRLW